MDVPWIWVPLVEATSNPLFEEMRARRLNPVVVTGRKIWTRATFGVGRAWSESGCNLGFATAYFVPWHSCKVVANFFDSNVYEFGRTWVATGRRWQYYLNRYLSTYAISRAERLFVNSHYCAEVLRKNFPGRASRFCVTSPGILPPMEAGKEIQPIALANNSRPYCLFVGAFSENKNQRRLIAAWAEWQRADRDAPLLVLVGHCDSDYLNSVILPAWQGAPRPEEIIVTDFLSDEEVSWCYRHAALYIQPSFAEGFGLPIIEAMSYGVPVAASNTTSIPEVGGDAAAYFDPGSAQSIMELIRDLWEHPEKRQLLIERGKSRPDIYTWKKNAHAVASQIEAVLAG